MSIRKGMAAIATVAALAIGAYAAEYTRGQNLQRFQKLRAYIVGYLDLNDAQKQQAREILGAAWRAEAPILRELKQGNTAATAAVKAGAPEQELQKLAEQQGTLAGQLAAAHMKSMAKFYAILTPAQKERADELSSEFKAKRQHQAQAGL